MNFCVGLQLITAFLTTSAGTTNSRPHATVDTVTLAELGYPSQNLDRQNALAEFWYEIPGDWEFVDRSTFHLDYSFPPSELPQSALLVFRLNGKLLHRLRLRAEGESHETLSIELPISHSSPQGLHISIHYYPSGTEFGCDRPDERAFYIHNNSSLELHHRPKAVVEEIRALPYPFAFPRAQKPISNILVLPDAPSDAELIAAATVGLTLGRWAELSPLRLHSLSASEYLEAIDGPNKEYDDANFIFVGARHGLNDALVQSGFSPELLQRNGGTISFKARSRSPGRALLWLGATDDENLHFVAEKLGIRHSDRRSTIFVSPDVSPDGDDGAKALWAKESISFKELGVSTLTLKGGPKRVQSFYFKRPKGLELDDESLVKLRLSYGSPPGTQSFLSIRVNGTRIHQQQIGLQSPDQLLLKLPSRRSLNENEDGTPSNYLVFDVEIRHQLNNEDTDNCDPVLDTAFLTLHEDSAWILKPKTPQTPELKFFPYPFSKVTPRQNLTLLLPIAPGPHTIDEIWNFSAALGRAPLHQEPKLHLKRFAESIEALPAGNLVMFDFQGNNPWVHRLKNKPAAAAFFDAESNYEAQVLAFKEPRAEGRQILLLQSQSPKLLASAALNAPKRRGPHLILDTYGQWQSGLGKQNSRYWVYVLNLWQKLKNYPLRGLEIFLLISNLILAVRWRDARRDYRELKEHLPSQVTEDS